MDGWIEGQRMETQTIDVQIYSRTIEGWKERWIDRGIVCTWKHAGVQILQIQLGPVRLYQQVCVCVCAHMHLPTAPALLILKAAIIFCLHHFTGAVHWENKTLAQSGKTNKKQTLISSCGSWYNGSTCVFSARRSLSQLYRTLTLCTNGIKEWR